jgi:hypothetical protein
MSRIEKSVKEILHSDNNKEQKHSYNFSELWEMIKWPTLSFNVVEKGTQIWTKDKENLFSGITAENIHNLEKSLDIQVQKVFRTTNKHDQKITSPHHIIVKMPRLNKNKEHWKIKEKNVNLLTKEKIVRIITDLKAETLNERKAWNNIISSFESK